MSAQGVHKITEDFEKALCFYTGAPYAVAVDNCSNALFLALYYEINVLKKWVNGFPKVWIPKHTYPSVPCEILHAGGKVGFTENKDYGFPPGMVEGMYSLNPTKVVDASLSFTCKMYEPRYHMCLSFTGPYKHLKLGKGGAILTDDEAAYNWLKKARFSGRSECSYHEDNFDENPVVGWNFYMMPEIAARGLQLMLQFFMPDGKPKHNEDLCLAYPDLSKFKIYQ